jgi:hypothetical protein
MYGDVSHRDETHRDITYGDVTSLYNFFDTNQNLYNDTLTNQNLFSITPPPPVVLSSIG